MEEGGIFCCNGQNGRRGKGGGTTQRAKGAVRVCFWKGKNAAANSQSQTWTYKKEGAGECKKNEIRF